MVGYWVEFAKKGTPNSKKYPTWLKFSEDEYYQILDIPIESASDIEKDFCAIIINEMRRRSSLK